MAADEERKTAEQIAYEELQCYSLSHGDPAFIHQHVVDAWTAQQADLNTRPMALTFALVGLHLHLEAGRSGRQVQRAHMALARRQRAWPALELPRERGAIRARDVMAAAPGAERDRAIDTWCAAVWAAYAESHGALAGWLQRHQET